VLLVVKIGVSIVRKRGIKMEEVKRYDFIFGADEMEFVVSEKGRFVEHSDYQTLSSLLQQKEQELERARTILERVITHKPILEVLAPKESLGSIQAEIEDFLALSPTAEKEGEG
jgi:hypothetical protein